MISFTDGARHRFGLDKYDFAVLYYDKETSVVGVELINDENAEGAIKLRKRETGGADIAAKSFVDYFGITPENTTMYNLSEGENERWIVWSLHDGVERKRGKRERGLA
ncbi:MAG TPA: hypothetical protein DDX54_06850 [Rhodospirillaceae bacterium]|nr:hypothetical protein [Rhodospirillaceae bacterium]